MLWYYKIYCLWILNACYFNSFHVTWQCVCNFIQAFYFFIFFLNLCFCYILFKFDCSIIFKNFAILIWNHISYCISYAKSCYYKRCTTCYTYYSHKHFFLISEYISCGYFISKLQPFPYKCYFFKYYAFSRLWSLWKHQLCWLFF